MQIIHTEQALRDALKAHNQIAFVPTMGNLHAGHLHLVKIAQTHAACVVVSIFVNPLQFGANEDLANYPRTLEADCDKLAQLGVDIVFVPTVHVIYPDFDGVDLHQSITVQPPPIANILCGASRPGHFAGVATVVLKLFNMVQPTVAVFGQKDFQQLFIIQSMVRQFNLPITIIAGETMREPNGLAMSSRNGYLNFAEKAQAVQLVRSLKALVASVQLGHHEYEKLALHATQQLMEQGWQVDYVTVRSAFTLLPPTSSETELVVLAAAKLGKTRLIDNIQFCAKPLK
ncbi:MAG: pantoate--beta-alanine ligase [Methylophilus sp.]|nr:pantoate--beta-alanine ligase [Methylophilus sp.]